MVGANDVAMLFETGNNQHGYRVDTVSLLVTTPPTDADNVEVSLWTSNSPRPNRKFLTFQNPQTIVPGSNTFHAPFGAPLLESHTTYFLIAAITTVTDSYSLGTTNDTAPLVGERLERVHDDGGEWTPAQESVMFAFAGTRAFAPTPSPNPPAASASVPDARILKIEPKVDELTLRPGDPIKLAIDVFGRSGVPDNNLARDVEIKWRIGNLSSDVSDGRHGSLLGANPNGTPEGTSVIYIAPDTRGRYTVIATIRDTSVCLAATNGETQQQAVARCTASFEVTVLSRAGASTPQPDPPVNPAGEIPVVLSDIEGDQYLVFTPEEGGTAVSPSQHCSISLPSRAVADNEFIGISLMTSNASSPDWRYAARGISCRVAVVDAATQAVSSYALREPAEICIPLPLEFYARITNVEMAVLQGESTVNLISSAIRITDRKRHVDLCGKLSQLPAHVVAVMHAGELLTEATITLHPTPLVPDTGPPNLPSTATLILLIALGCAILAAAVALVRPTTVQLGRRSLEGDDPQTGEPLEWRVKEW